MISRASTNGVGHEAARAFARARAPSFSAVVSLADLLMFGSISEENSLRKIAAIRVVNICKCLPF